MQKRVKGRPLLLEQVAQVIIKLHPLVLCRRLTCSLSIKTFVHEQGHIFSPNPVFMFQFIGIQLFCLFFSFSANSPIRECVQHQGFLLCHLGCSPHVIFARIYILPFDESRLV